MPNLKVNIIKGFTTIELLSVLCILFILTFIGLNMFISFRQNQSLQKDTETIVEVLAEAHSQTLSSKNASQYGVHVDTQKVTLFLGNSYNAGNATNKEFSLSASDIVLTTNFSDGGNDIVFQRLTGEAVQSGTITVSVPSTSQIKTVTIYKTGVIETN
jgi:Tfp pilus assembly protein FimT